MDNPGNIFDVTIIISNALSVIDSKLLLTGTLPTATVIIESHKAKVSSKIPIVESHNTASVCLYRPGPSCSKLTTLLVYVSLQFQTLISEICQYFLLKKCEKLLQCAKASHVFSTKSISVFSYKVIKHLTS